MTALFRPAPLGLYIDWLRLHLAAGGQFTHHYDYPHDCARFLVATADFTTGGECGTNSRSILIPVGVNHLGGALGHNKLYFFDRPDAASMVPTYNDPEFLALPGIREHVAEQGRRDAAVRAEIGRDVAAHEAVMRRSDLGRHVLGERGTAERQAIDGPQDAVPAIHEVEPEDAIPPGSQRRWWRR